jgi:hypothetical protein
VVEGTNNNPAGTIPEYVTEKRLRLRFYADFDK